MLAIDLTGVGYTLLVVLGISLLIFIHELGHFLAAKLAGVRVDAFSLGFGPRLFGFRRGETDYRVSAVPLGGYVKMYGEMPGEGDPADARSLFNKSVAWRFLIFAGGVVMNLIFALVAFPIVFRAGVPFTAPVVGSVDPGSPAWQAALEPGDRVVSVSGAPCYSFEQLTMEGALAGEKGLVLGVQRGDERVDVTVHPAFDRRVGLKLLGIRPASAEEVTVRLLPDPSPARQAGLREGDRLLAWDGAPPTPERLGRHELDQQRDPVAALDRTLRVVVERDGQRVETELRPVAVDDAVARLGVMPLTTKVSGLRADVDPQVRRALGELGLVEGDVVIGLTEGNRTHPVLDGEDLLASLDRAGADSALQVLRAGPQAAEIGGAPRRILPVPPGLRGAEARRVLSHVAFTTDDLTGSVLVQPGHAAARAGLRTGDRILALDGKDVRGWPDVVRAVADARRDGRPSLRVRWQPFASEAGTPLPPRDSEVALLRAPLPSYGFVPSLRERQETYRVTGFLPSLRAGFVCSMDTLRQLYVTLKRILAGSVSAENLGGIITISVATYETARSGWQRFLYFLAILSLNLAFINILPIPVLDGGQLLFLGIEAIKGSPVSIRVMNYAQIVGLVLVLALMIFVTFNDIRRLFG